MDGLLAVTDHGWYDRLSQDPGPKDANFWRPSTRAFRLAPGTPFLFKLKAPRNAIAGFGYFAGFTVLPDWLAWETFGEANGVSDLPALRARLGKIQRGARIDADPGGRIGCCMIAEARFFREHDWVEQPRDWPPRTQTGATYNLAEGEGLRVWAECLARSVAQDRPPDRALEPRDIAASAPRYGAPTLHVPRLGQGIFRVQVLDAYGFACAVTEEHSLPVVEAAHIRPYSTGGEHRVANGLALRTDLHRLFDRGYVTVDQENRFVVGRRLKDEFSNGRSYYELHGRRLVEPAHPSRRPDRVALAWHREHAFLG